MPGIVTIGSILRTAFSALNTTKPTPVEWYTIVMNDYATKQAVQEIVDKAVTDLSEIIASFASQVDSRFNSLESKVEKLQIDMNLVLNRLDSIEKDIAINDDERAVMGMQLTRLHDWVEKAAQKIGVEFVH